MRDYATLALAIDRITDTCGESVKRDTLSGDLFKSCKDILTVSHMAPQRQLFEVEQVRLGHAPGTVSTDAFDTVSFTVAEMLGEIGPVAKDAVPALIIALKDKDKQVRGNAAVALGKVGPSAKDAVPALTVALKDKDVEVREAVQKALGLIKAKK